MTERLAVEKNVAVICLDETEAGTGQDKLCQKIERKARQYRKSVSDAVRRKEYDELKLLVSKLISYRSLSSFLSSTDAIGLVYISVFSGYVKTVKGGLVSIFNWPTFRVLQSKLFGDKAPFNTTPLVYQDAFFQGFEQALAEYSPDNEAQASFMTFFMMKTASAQKSELERQHRVKFAENPGYDGQSDVSIGKSSEFILRFEIIDDDISSLEKIATEDEHPVYNSHISDERLIHLMALARIQKLLFLTIRLRMHKTLLDMSTKDARDKVAETEGISEFSVTGKKGFEYCRSYYTFNIISLARVDVIDGKSFVINNNNPISKRILEQIAIGMVSIIGMPNTSIHKEFFAELDESLMRVIFASKGDKSVASLKQLLTARVQKGIKAKDLQEDQMHTFMQQYHGYSHTTFYDHYGSSKSRNKYRDIRDALLKRVINQEKTNVLDLVAIAHGEEVV